MRVVEVVSDEDDVEPGETVKFILVPSPRVASKVIAAPLFMTEPLRMMQRTIHHTQAGRWTAMPLRDDYHQYSGAHDVTDGPVYPKYVG